MLFTFFKIQNFSQNLNIFYKKLVSSEIDASMSFIQENNSVSIIFNNSEFGKCVISQINDQPFLLINTFDKVKILNVISFFSDTLHVTITPVVISTENFKKIIKAEYQIIELEAIIHGPILEEITISGSDIHDAEFYQLIMEKGEIRKVVVYLDTIQNLQIGAVIKIFSDGKISIIPEIQVDRVVSIFDKILKGLEIV